MIMCKIQTFKYIFLWTFLFVDMGYLTGINITDECQELHDRPLSS